MQTPQKSDRTQWTILKLLQWTRTYFKSNEIEGARAAAEILLAHVLGRPRIDLYVRYDQPMNPPELAAFKALIKRRVAGEPISYIVGEKEFWSLAFTVTPDVLIPRPETERLVEIALPLLPESPGDATKRALELGVGSGAVILSLAKERPGHHYFASDVSPAALGVARKNARRHGLAETVSFFAGDWTGPLSPRRARFDLILSNPPYIPRGDLPGLQREIRAFEPVTALDGAPDGLHCLRRIIDHAHRCLNPGGALLLEMGWDQKEGVRQLIHGSGRYEGVEFFKDYGGHDRVVSALKKKE
ncbi:MAG: peptide chain release factor N(5)-glutamine methyltransferase [Desulfobacterales bacterium]|nr:peptide chain release factor N(5)-glutamine methyltransferase [Desulfobacterales bacterium]